MMKKDNRLCLTDSFAFSNDFIMTLDVFQVLYPENTPRKLYINVNDESIDSTQEILSEYQQNIDPSMPIISRKSIEQQYKEETRAGSVMGAAISVVIALVGILNFINSMVTAIISRKKEFAML